MLNDPITVAGRRIGQGEAPYVIAEAGSNFNQSLDIALRLIDVAAAAKVDAVKFQLFRADVLYPGGGQMHDLFKTVELNPDWLDKLKAHANAQGLAFLASVFDPTSLKTLLDLGTPAIKVASSETTNLPLLGKIAQAGIPLFLATGICEFTDVAMAVEFCTGLGVKDISLMQCGSVYPLPPEEADLAVMETLSTAFGGPVGYSDHTLGIAVAIAAAARGARVIEKHFTLDRSMKGPDHSYAIEPDELKQMVAGIHAAHQAIGSPVKRFLAQERAVGRRDGLWAARNIAAGETIDASAIEIKRPATGIMARYLGAVTGTKAQQEIAAGTPISWDAVQF